MKILVVGGTGMIGASAALYLREQGNDVTIAARAPANETSPVASFPILLGDYMTKTFTAEMLAGFDAVVFAAGQDVRHMPRGADEGTFWDAAQSDGVPRFAALAKRAGVGVSSRWAATTTRCCPNWH